MRIGFDARMIAWKGVGTYSRSLLKRLANLPDIEIVAIGNDDSRDGIPAGDNLEIVSVNEEVLSSRSLNKIGNAVNRAGCGLFHSPYVVAPGNLECPLLITAHDIIPLLFPQSIPGFRQRRVYKSLLANAVRTADHIITVSTVSQSYLLAHFNLPISKVSVILDGVGREFSPRSDDEIAATVEKYDIRQPLILWLGEFSAHKNVNALVSAYASLSRELRSRYQLVLAGEKSMDWEAVRKEAVSRGVGSQVRFPGFISNADLPALFCSADVFCFPSLYEGFGLPPLEAMACGTPVICSNSSSLPEVVGDGGLLVAPRAAAFNTAITEVLTNESLRQRLMRRGRERAKLFSWDTAVAKTVELYRELAAEG